MTDVDQLLGDDAGVVVRLAAEAATVPDFADLSRRGRARRTRRQAAVVGSAALAVAVVMGAAQFVGGGSPSGERDPVDRTPTVSPSPYVLQSTVTPELAEELVAGGFVFIEDLGAADVAVTQAEAVRNAGTHQQERRPAVAALGTLNYLELWVDRPVWVVIYEDLEQSFEGAHPPRGVELVTPSPSTFFVDLAVFVDAHTGEVLGASTIAPAEEQGPQVGGPGK